MINYGVSAGAGLAALVIAALFWTVGNRMLPRVTTILVMAGVAGLTSTWAGKQAGGAVGTVTKILDSVTVDKFDAKVSGLVAFAVAFVVGVMVWTKNVVYLTLAAAALLPLALRSATGDLGHGLTQVVVFITRFVGGIVGPLTGMQ